MTNLFLTITLLTNTQVAIVQVSNTIPQHIYSIQTTSDLDTNIWYSQWVWQQDVDTSNKTFFSYTANTNIVFYRAVDEGNYPLY